MTRARIVCGPLSGSNEKLLSGEEVIYLSTRPEYGNVYLDLDTFEENLGSKLDPLSRDLCEIAAYVYLADKAVPRGEFENWSRDLSFFVRVSDPRKWNSVETILANTIATLSGDNISFRFAQKGNGENGAGQSRDKGHRLADRSDCVCLFSGGLDSFAGAVHLLREGRRPLFVSHYVSSLKLLQTKLMTRIEQQLSGPVEHLQYRVCPKRLRQTEHPFKARESSHRARSFLFMSFAAAAAVANSLRRIYICENGILAMNVPISEARKGTRSTRHAHPLYLTYFKDLIDSLYGDEFSVLNPFLYWTKTQEVELLKHSDFHRMIRNTVSCWGYPSQTVQYKGSNHCGYCLPCIVRRVSVAAAGLGQHDDRYFVNVFNLGDNGSEGQSRNITDLMHFCEQVSSRSVDDLVYDYPEFVMIEAQRDAYPKDKLAKIVDVYREFAQDCLEVSRALSRP